MSIKSSVSVMDNRKREHVLSQNLPETCFGYLFQNQWGCFEQIFCSISCGGGGGHSCCDRTDTPNTCCLHGLQIDALVGNHYFPSDNRRTQLCFLPANWICYLLETKLKRSSIYIILWVFLTVLASYKLNSVFLLLPQDLRISTSPSLCPPHTWQGVANLSCRQTAKLLLLSSFYELNLNSWFSAHNCVLIVCRTLKHELSNKFQISLPFLGTLFIPLSNLHSNLSL